MTCIGRNRRRTVRTSVQSRWNLEVPEFPLYSLLLEFCPTCRIVLGVLVLYGFVMSAFSRRHWTFRVQPAMTVSQRQLLVNRIITGGLGPFNMGHRHFSAIQAHNIRDNTFRNMSLNESFMQLHILQYKFPETTFCPSSASSTVFTRYLR
jgi:hypothetical protein